MPSTRTKPRRNLQEGQAIVLIALLILVLFGMLGLAVDSGRGYVDRRDQQTAVDAAALAAGDEYDNFGEPVASTTIPPALSVYQRDLRLYGAATLVSSGSTPTGPGNTLTKNTWSYSFSGGYTLDIEATNTLFNGYQFIFTSKHSLPLAFIQVFGGSPTVGIGATATSIVGNQRQTPALLTLSNGACATQMKGNAATLTILGDAYSNGTACVDPNLHIAGNCYGATNSTCNQAVYFCYSSIPGTIPYDPQSNGGVCNPGDIVGAPVVPAPTLPDPGYTANSQQYYLAAGVTYNRGGYTEMTPGQYNNWSVSGGGCYFLDAGVYTWNGGYSSQGGLTSNELKAPNEQYYLAPGTTQTAASAAGNDFWGSCAGTFNISLVQNIASGNGIKHQGGGKWGVELSSVRYDQFVDPTFTGGTGNPCSTLAGCRRESAPSACQEIQTVDGNNDGINVNVTQNAPGAQYYNVYVNRNGCDSVQDHFGYMATYLAPGWADGGSPPAVAAAGPWTGTLANARGGLTFFNCAQAGVTLCGFDYNSMAATARCNAYDRLQLCRPPQDEVAPQCFVSCPAPAGVPQDNNAMALEYGPTNKGGDVANENYCQQTPTSGGDPAAPCGTAKITPGAVQFWFPGGSCLDQRGNGSTHVFSGEQYNWIVIYEKPTTVATSCSQNSQKLNGSSLTQYIGTIYSPTASWDILGANTAPLAGQVICWSALITGSTNAGIYFNPNYSPAPPAARLIN